MSTQVEWDLHHVEAELESLRDPTPALGLVRSLRAGRKRIEENGNLSDEGKQAQLVKLRDEAEGALGALKHEARVKLAAARKVARDAEDAHKPKAGEDCVAYELQLTRAHNLVRRELAAGVPLSQLLNDVVESRDRVAFQALRDLAPGHVKAEASTSQHKRVATEALAAQLEQAEVPLLSKAELKAREISAKANELEQLSSLNLNELEKEAKGFGAAHVFISSRDRVIDIDSGNPIGPNGRPVQTVPSPRTAAEFTALPPEERHRVPAAVVGELFSPAAKAS
jgi:hypothetical protein